MKTRITDDLSLVVAAQHNVAAKETACLIAALDHQKEIHVNTVNDSRPAVSAVFHHPTSALRALAANGKPPVRVKRRQLWAAGAHFPNAHAFPDNPLRTAYDYLHR